MSFSKIKKIQNEEERKEELNFFFKNTAIKGLIISIIILAFTWLIKGGAYYILSLEMPAFKVLIIIYACISIIILLIGLFFNFENMEVFLKVGYIYDLIGFFMKTICVLYIIMIYFFSMVRVSGQSMSPSFENDDFLIVRTIGYSPKKGDVVIIHITEKKYDFRKEDLFIKRLVAKPGDVISSQAGYLCINGQYYTVDDEKVDFSGETITLGKNQYYAIGDNHNNSVDSRVLGPIDDDDILGKVVFRLFPFKSFGGVK